MSQVRLLPRVPIIITRSIPAPALANLPLQPIRRRTIAADGLGLRRRMVAPMPARHSAQEGDHGTIEAAACSHRGEGPDDASPALEEAQRRFLAYHEALNHSPKQLAHYRDTLFKPRS